MNPREDTRFQTRQPTAASRLIRLALPLAAAAMLPLTSAGCDDVYDEGDAYDADTEIDPSTDADDDVYATDDGLLNDPDDREVNSEDAIAVDTGNTDETE